MCQFIGEKSLYIIILGENADIIEFVWLRIKMCLLHTNIFCDLVKIFNKNSACYLLKSHKFLSNSMNIKVHTLLKKNADDKIVADFQAEMRLNRSKNLFTGT